MVRDINQQILFLKRLYYRRQYDGYDLEGRGSYGRLRDENAGVKVVLRDVLREGAHLFYADRGFRAEFDPDGADLGGRVRGGIGWKGVFFEHGARGSGRESHLLAAGEDKEEG